MKRRLLLLLLLLVAGAIVNVAVAWGTDAFTAEKATFYPRYSAAVVVTCRQGWPIRSLTSESEPMRDIFGKGSIPNPQPVIVGNWQLAQHPIWPGFAINTVFYAGILWLLFAAPLALRRRRRIKRGLCPKCAYDLRATQADVCPECGATR